MANIVFTTYSAALTGTVNFGCALSFLVPVVAKTGNYSALATDSNNVFTNGGAVASVTFTLPAAASGFEYTFVVDNTNGIVIKASGTNTIRAGPVVSSAGGTMTSTMTGSSITIVAINTTEWMATSVLGSWTEA